jgi:serine/threonine-protein phosphatase 2B catalytic subunit
MSLAVINTNTNTSKNYSATMDPTTNTNQSAIDTHRRQIIKRKVLAIGKLSRSYAVLKEHPELVKQLKTLSANGKLPFGTLANGEQGIREGK